MVTNTDAEGQEPSEPRESSPSFREGAWWTSLLKSSFGRSFWGFLVFAIITGTICYTVLGRVEFVDALETDVDLFLRILPRVAIALTVAGLLWVTLPRDRVTALIGKESGMRGLFIATAAGIITPGGPTSAYALLAVLGASGADRGAMIAYIASWATLGVQRLLVWDVPFMGAEFSLVRFLVCLPLPIVAGLIARRLPLQMEIVSNSWESRS
jgi:uncharacterized membrane protein YraQ (UPF0718 family)